MSLAPRHDKANKNKQNPEIQKEGPIPFLVYDSNTRSNLKFLFINILFLLYFYRIHFNFSRRRCNQII